MRAFSGAACNQTTDFMEAVHETIDFELAKDCKNFSSIDDQDFKRLEAENERLNSLITGLRDKLR